MNSSTLYKKMVSKYFGQLKHMSLPPPPLDENQHQVHVPQHGPAEEEPQVPPHLPQEAGPVADEELRLAGEEEVLEPEVRHPLRAQVGGGEPLLPAEVLVRVLGAAKEKKGK